MASKQTFPLEKLFPDKLFLIAGPCMLENETMALQIAREMKDLCLQLDIPYIFKASFDKANRSSASSHRGPGLDAGLASLARIKSELNLPVTSDVHTPEMVYKCGQTLDLLQIPAFLARQTDLFIEAAKTGKPLNVKKGQFMAPEEMRYAVEKFRTAGGTEIALTERGTFFGYGNLVVDFRSISIMKKIGVPVIYDATHSLQRPASRQGSSGGDRQYIENLLMAQVAAGVNGVFIETHLDPSKAKSDRETQMPLAEMPRLLSKIKSLYDFVHKT